MQAPNWVSLVAQLVKSLPAVQETPVQFLGREDPLEEGMATHSGILILENPCGQRSLAGYDPWGCKESDTNKRRTLHLVTSTPSGGFGFVPIHSIFPLTVFDLAVSPGPESR